jgi:hypothetical protein
MAEAEEAPDLLSALPDALLLRVACVIGHRDKEEPSWCPQHLCRLRACSRRVCRQRACRTLVAPLPVPTRFQRSR